MLKLIQKQILLQRNENFQKFCFDISNLCLNKNLKDKDSLMKTEFSDSGITVEDELTNVISKLGENIVIKKLHHESHDGLFSEVSAQCYF